MSEYRLNARLNENVHLDIQTDNLADMAQALQFFGLANTKDERQQELPLQPAAEPAPAPAEEPKAKKPRKPAATQPAAEPAPVETAPTEPAADSPSEGNAAAAVSAPEAPAASTASSPVSATPAEAAEAVRAYGAKRGIAAARELLQKHGFAKTAEITADKAGLIVAEASAE